MASIKQLSAIALGLAVAATVATPSFAQQAEGGRDRTLQECNTEANKMSQNTWGVQQLQQYRSCMMQRGEQQE